jgi:phosphatidylglycerol:prolipoprotein diacylglycerol transferase
MGLTTQYYFQHPLEILKIWKGGLGIFGGIIGGLIALIIYCHANKQNFWEWTDIVAPGLLIAQAIGRWGNFVNQEVYGPPTDLPWKIYIDPAHRLPGYENFEYYHPLFLYESLLTLIGGLLLLYVARKYKDKLYIGDVFNMYLIYYPLGRFGLEFIRLDPSVTSGGGININQIAMLIVGVLALITFILRHTVFQPKAVQAVQTEGIDVSGMPQVTLEPSTESRPAAGESEIPAESEPKITDDDSGKNQNLTA